MPGLVVGIAFLALVGARGNAPLAAAVRAVTVALEQPQALAVGPEGTPYVVDTGRDQVLRLVAGSWLEGRCQLATAPGTPMDRRATGTSASLRP